MAPPSNLQSLEEERKKNISRAFLFIAPSAAAAIKAISSKKNNKSAAEGKEKEKKES